ncbi:MAG: hypothetical protein KDA79_15695 [Planctomycetaceae bacterium]|nr:hypothetical protein [Planctomycetaceae bacterium]
MTISRRQFLHTSAGSALAAPAVSGLLWPLSATAADGKPKGETRPQRLAVVTTIYRRNSHADHIAGRFLTGYSINGRHHQPAHKVVSMHVEQVGADDLSVGLARQYGFPLYPTVREALRAGSDSLNVDAVLYIGEHGDYPRNDIGQKLYPRHRMLGEVVAEFRDSGRSVPVFNDKHLSTRWEECQEMVDDSRRLDFAFLAGSSLPVTRRMPAIDMPWQADLKESVCVGYGGVDSYDFHALETAQCMSERRAGGETGIRKVHALKGDNFWQRIGQSDCEITRKLIVSALTRSHNLPVDTGFPTDAVTMDWFHKSLPNTTGYLIEHRDGFRTTMLLTGIRDFNYAGMLADGNIVSCQMYLPMPGHGSTTADFFNPLCRHVETTMIEGKAPYPVERTLLTSGMVIGAVDSLFAGEKPIATPDMAVKYMGPKESMYWMG